MKKVIRLTESELVRIVKRVISEQPISPLGAASRINLSKAPRISKYNEF